jgi:tetratricopeptide (TPR) repeat protein
MAGAAAQPVATGSGVADACTFARMEAAPLTVIEPCTALLRQSGLAPERRSEALFVRARAHHRNGSLDLAAEDYDAAIELAPNNEELYLGRANIEFRRGHDTNALALMQKAIAINPSNPRVLRSIGAVFSSAGQTEDAIRFLSAALRIDPKEPYALLLRSQLHAQKRRYEEALADADALVAIPPEEINRIGYLDGDGKQRDFHVVALSHRADIQENLGNFDLAEADLNRAIEYKSTPAALLARGELLSNRKGKEAAALRDLDAVIKLESREPRAHFSRGMALFSLRRFAEAAKAFDTAVALQSAYPAAFRMRARVQLEVGKPDAALQDFITALRQDSTMMRQVMPALSAGGYWPSPEIPTSITAELRQAIRKCLIDRKCT